MLSAHEFIIPFCENVINPDFKLQEKLKTKIEHWIDGL